MTRIPEGPTSTAQSRALVRARPRRYAAASSTSQKGLRVRHSDIPETARFVERRAPMPYPSQSRTQHARTRPLPAARWPRILAGFPVRFVPYRFFCMGSRSDDLLARLTAEFEAAYGEPSLADRIMIENVAGAQGELESIAAVIEADGTTVAGSRGQIRPHPLLGLERELRADVIGGLEKLGLDPRHRAAARRVAEANALTRR